MDYQVGKVGRVIVARGFDGEDVYGEIESLSERENIRGALVVLFGGLRSAKMVVGPKTPTGPIDPTFAEFDDAREVAGVGTIFHDEDGPKLHLHAAIGRGKETLVGCPRGGANVFCVLEVIIVEIEGIDASRRFEPDLALKLLALGAAKNSSEG
jgi:predicted DNA-binding protein with PD1-like motif